MNNIEYSEEQIKNKQTAMFPNEVKMATHQFKSKKPVKQKESVKIQEFYSKILKLTVKVKNFHMLKNFIDYMTCSFIKLSMNVLPTI